MTAILPEDVDELPVGFQTVGHVAHLNLRENYAPHKHLIAEVLRDKNPKITTVINKIDDVGAENVYRTFSYEVLAGTDDLNVEVKEQDCIFRFDYSKVYWNSRLNTEHERMVNNFREGEAVCDITAGIGPFAVPAGKKRVFVWANDLNPESYAHLRQSIATNKVGNFVRPFNEDGRTFIRRATQELLSDERTVSIPRQPSKRRKPGKQHEASEPATNGTLEPVKPALTYTQPRTFQHYVSNLPASGIEFLSSFRGLHTASQRSLFSPHTTAKLPMIHTYTFGPKDLDTAPVVVCAKASEQLGYELKLGDEHDTIVYDVRDVAPNKRMFCISFRLPEQVAFAAD